jgi:hypothetical protein
MMACRVCNRKSPARKEWIAPSGERACSDWCFDALLQRKIMIDPTDFEREAMEHAGNQGGEYLESIGKTDLAKLTADEWATFTNCVCSGYIDKLGEIVGRIEADARYLRAKIEPLPV